MRAGEVAGVILDSVGGAAKFSRQSLVLRVKLGGIARSHPEKDAEIGPLEIALREPKPQISIAPGYQYLVGFHSLSSSLNRSRFQVRPVCLIGPEVAYEGMNPAFESESNTAGKCIFAAALNIECFSKVVPVKVDRADREAVFKDH